MEWIGVVLGAIVGASIGGFPGMIVGGIIGAVVGGWLAEQFGSAVSGGPNVFGDEDQDIPIGVLLAGCFLARFARETNNLTKERVRDLIVDICGELAEEIEKDSADRDVMSPSRVRLHVRERLDSWATNDALFELVLKVTHEEGDERNFAHFLLRSGWRVACRDNKLEEEEVDWLATAALAMKMPLEEFALFSLPYRRRKGDDEEKQKAREILGVSAEATPEEIDARFRELGRKYHPDRYAASEPEVREVMTEKFAKISEAYNLLRNGTSTYWGLDTQKKELYVPKERDTVRCFFCKQKCRLPAETRYFDSARCGKCQALLLFEEDLAQLFLEHAA